MHFSTIAYALATFSGLSAAVPWQGKHAHGHLSNPGSPTGTSTTTTCWTFKASNVPKSSAWTSWYTSTTSCTSTVTSTVTKTSTPSASTTTITSSTTITGTTSTLTQTDTSTTTETDTETDTTTTTTTTTTTSTSTSTVPTSPGFTPIQTSLPGSSYSGSAGSDPESKKRSLGADLPVLGSSGSQDTSKASYVQGVKCQKWIGECKTTTITTTVTSTASTPISSTTTTITSTSMPSATTTVTSTETDTTTTTTTATETDTSTSTIPTSTTVYAACASSNLADTYLANPIVNIAGGSPNEMTINFPTADSAYDCCVSAFTVTGSSPEGWLYNANDGGDPCFGAYPGTGDSCAAGQNSYTFTANASPDAVGQASTVGNGYCGIVNSGNVFT